MAENDIYDSKSQYEGFLRRLDSLVIKPVDRQRRLGRLKYWVKNPENLQYFRKLDIYFRSADISFVRRIRVFRSLQMICYATEKDLSAVGRDDINGFLSYMHQAYSSIKSKETFIRDTKYIWRVLFPERDEKGRPDETIVPYVVRHLSRKIDRSREKMRPDRLSWEEFERIVDYFGSDPRIQAYLTLSLESLARPQELLYIKLGNIQLFDNFAKLFITEHGKEGVGLLQCIDSYPYLIKWLERHPLKSDKNAYLFINTGHTNNLQQLKPWNVNKMLRKACKDLKINKPITCYSLKRNGVTMRRMRGDSDMEIQHAARWTSMNQLKTYDLSGQDDAFRAALEKRGIIPNASLVPQSETKECPFCNQRIGFSENICPHCHHVLNRKLILEEQNKDAEILRLRDSLSLMQNNYEQMKQQIVGELMQQIRQTKEAI